MPEDFLVERLADFFLAAGAFALLVFDATAFFSGVAAGASTAFLRVASALALALVFGAFTVFFRAFALGASDVATWTVLFFVPSSEV